MEDSAEKNWAPLLVTISGMPNLAKTVLSSFMMDLGVIKIMWATLKELSHSFFSVILATYKITFKLKETWKKQYNKIEKHQRDNDKS